MYCSKGFDKTYRFYAAFENTLCRDYVTEKFLFGMKSNMIPVVYGGANYTKFAPPKSYINANDFKNVKELADYLKFLIDNPREYIKYFWWKKHYKYSAVEGRLCGLCVKLHHRASENKTKIYEDIHGFVEILFECEEHFTNCNF